MRSQPKRSYRMTWITGIAGIAAAVVASAWFATGYVRQVALDVELSDARSRVEAASRARVALARNLADTAEALALEPGAVSRLRHSCDRAAAATALPIAVPVDPRAFGDFVETQRELSERVEQAWSRLAASRAAGARFAIEDLGPRLARAQREVADEIVAYELRLATVREAKGRLPATVVAGGR